jgi:hypothetical protein
MRKKNSNTYSHITGPNNAATKRMRRRLVPLVASALVCCAALAFAVRAYNQRGGSAFNLVGSALPVPVVQGPASSYPLPSTPKQTELEVELITVGPDGFEPTQIERPQGPFLLAIENRSSIEDISLSLELEQGGDPLSIPMLDFKLVWKQEMELEQGNYILTEANHTDPSKWKCTIVITK